METETLSDKYRREVAEGALRAIEAVLAEVEIPGAVLSCGMHSGLPFILASVLTGRTTSGDPAFLRSRAFSLIPYGLEVGGIIGIALEAAGDAFARAARRGITYRGRPWPSECPR